MGGFTGSVNFTANGLPSGATAAFNQSAVNLASTQFCHDQRDRDHHYRHFTPPAAYNITVTGTSGSVSHSDTVTLVVADFSISATPSSQTTTSGNFTSYTVNSGNINGFSGNISLSASGLPSGASASFNPASITAGNSSTMTFHTSISTPGSTNTVDRQRHERQPQPHRQRDPHRYLRRWRVAFRLDGHRHRQSGLCRQRGLCERRLHA